MRNDIETRHKNLPSDLQKLADELKTDKNIQDIIDKMIEHMDNNGQTVQQDKKKSVEDEFLRIGMLF